MNIDDMFFYSLKNLSHQHLRSWLTILGIVIGISAIVVLVGLADGLRKDVDDQLSAMGPNTIVLIPFNIEGTTDLSAGPIALRASSGKLFDKDVERVEKIAGVKVVAKLISGNINVKFRKNELTMDVRGIEPEIFKEVTPIDIEEGRYLEESDRHVALIGHNIATDTFDDPIDVGSKLIINGSSFRVIGIIEKTGAGAINFDNVIILHFEDARDLYSDSYAPREIRAARIEVKEGFDPEEVAEEIESSLLSFRKLKEEDKDFSLITPKFVNDTVGSILTTITIFLGAVAVISLIVGGIGVSNTMFMSVLERTKEIGVVKAIGAKKNEILALFLFESAILGVIGGIIGIGFGYGILLLISLLGVTTLFSPSLALMAFAFAFGVGLIAGYIPARNGADIEPMEAMRYE